MGKPLTVARRELTSALEQALVRKIGEPRYKLWFDRHTRFAWDDDVLTVGVPNRHFEEWLHKTFRDALAAAAREVFGRPLAVRFVIDPQLFQAARREQQAVAAAPAPPPPASRKARPRRPPRPPPPRSAHVGGGGCPSSWSGRATASPTPPP